MRRVPLRRPRRVASSTREDDPRVNGTSRDEVQARPVPEKRAAKRHVYAGSETMLVAADYSRIVFRRATRMQTAQGRARLRAIRVRDAARDCGNPH